MDYNISADYEEMCKKAAERIAAVIKQKVKQNGKAVIGFATGSTPIGVYQELARIYEHDKNDSAKAPEDKLSFEKVITFNLDEYVVDPKKHPDFYTMAIDGEQVSYHGFMDQHLFSKVNIKKENTHVPDALKATPEELEKECKEYEQKIHQATSHKQPRKGRAHTGVDLQVVGIGENGHIGFCEPNTPAAHPESRTSVVDVNLNTIATNIEKFGFAAPKAISMGLGTVMDADEVLLVANGPKKAAIIGQTGRSAGNAAAENGERKITFADMVRGNPATVLHDHPNAHAFVDEHTLTVNQEQIETARRKGLRDPIVSLIIPPNELAASARR